MNSNFIHRPLGLRELTIDLSKPTHPIQGLHLILPPTLHKTSQEIIMHTSYDGYKRLTQIDHER